MTYQISTKAPSAIAFLESPPVIAGKYLENINKCIKSGDIIAIYCGNVKRISSEKTIFFKDITRELGKCRIERPGFIFHKCIKEKEGKKKESISDLFENRVIYLDVENDKLLDEKNWPQRLLRFGKREKYGFCTCELSKKVSQFIPITMRTFSFFIPKFPHE